MVTRTYNPSALEAEVGGFKTETKPKLFRQSSQNKQNILRNWD